MEWNGSAYSRETVSYVAGTVATVVAATVVVVVGAFAPDMTRQREA